MKLQTFFLRYNSPDRACLIIGALGFLVLALAVTFSSPPRLIYDEPYYMNTVKTLEDEGLSSAFLIELEGFAGPLYSVVHYLCAPLTHLAPRGVRWVNLVLLLGLILILRQTLRLFGSEAALVSSLGVMAVPMTWVLSGMALTEIPAMFCAALGLLLLFDALRREGKIAVALSCFGGLAFSLAILGRQTFLVVLPLLPILCLRHAGRRTRLLLFGACAAALPLYVFYVWGGLIPPKATGIEAEGGMSPLNALSSCAYAGAILLILRPRWFDLHWKTIITIAVVMCGLHFLTNLTGLTPALSVAGRLLPASILPLYSATASGLLSTLGVLYLLATAKNAWRRRDDTTFVFIILAAVCVVGTALKITSIFSSRYPATALPLLLLSAHGFDDDGYTRPIRYAVGVFIGILVLLSYYVKWSTI